MTRATVDLEFIRGDDVVRAFAWQDEDGVAIDLTGRTYAAQIRRYPDAATDWVFTVNVSGPAGIVTLTMLAAVTATIPPGRWHWDLEEVIGGYKTTPLGGRVVVTADVTR